MRATVMYGAGDVRVEDVPDARLIEPTDALARVRCAVICGSHLWRYKYVHFTPGARTAWHAHPHGQTIWGQGVGLCQREGGPVEVIRPGDRVFFEPGENHWHGAAPTRFMTHIAIQQADAQGNVVTWGEHGSDEQYAQAPSITKGED